MPDGARAWLVALEGPSGAGKTTLARKLAPLLGGYVVTEAFDRLDRSFPLTFHGRQELYELERRLLREEGRRWSEGNALCARGTGAVLDTATFGPLAYSWGLREGVDPQLDVVDELVRTARRMSALGGWGIPDLTVYLAIPSEVARGRARMDPKAHPPETADRHAVVGRWERLLYERELPRSLPGRFFSVTGEGSPEQVALLIQDRLERFGPVPGPSAEETDRLLRVFEGSGRSGRPELRDPNP